MALVPSSLHGSQSAHLRSFRGVSLKFMCRSIQQLRGLEPPASEAEIHDAALQLVRKVSGYRSPSAANSEVFFRAVDEIAVALDRLLNDLTVAPGSRIPQVTFARH